jgi:hypothetical protein
MLRSILAVVAGFAAWSALWIAGNQTMLAALGDRVRPDQSTDDPLVCSLLLVLSVACSLLAGWVTALVDPRRWWASTWAQALILLAVGIAVEVGMWELLPAWYHIVFLILLVPCTLLGARLRRRGRGAPAAARVEA